MAQALLEVSPEISCHASAENLVCPARPYGGKSNGKLRQCLELSVAVSNGHGHTVIGGSSQEWLSGGGAL
jgi:hypothetical protein